MNVVNKTLEQDGFIIRLMFAETIGQELTIFGFGQLSVDNSTTNFSEDMLTSVSQSVAMSDVSCQWRR